MSNLIRSVLVAAALIGSVSAVSAASYNADQNSYGDHSAITYFDKVTHKAG